MKSNLSQPENALTQFAASLDYLNSAMAREDPALHKQFRAAAIQAFEFCYELTVKMLRRQLEQIAANPVQLRELAFLDFIRVAAEAGLVSAIEPIRIYREMRNITSHTYDETKAEIVVAELPSFLQNARGILADMELPDYHPSYVCQEVSLLQNQRQSGITRFM